MNRRPLALKVFGGLAPATYPGREYLAAFFAAASKIEDFDPLLATRKFYLSPLAPTDSARAKNWLRLQQAQALLAAKRPAETLSTADAAAGSAVLRETRVVALLELNRTEEAPGYLAELRAREPWSSRDYAFGVVQRWLADRKVRAMLAADNYIRRFGASVNDLTQLAAGLAEIAAESPLERCASEAAAHGFAPQLFLKYRAQTRLAHGAWRSAAGLVARFRALTPTATPAEEFWLTWNEHLVEAARNPAPAAQSTRVEFLASQPVTIPVYRRTCETLQLAGRTKTARRILSGAGRQFPASRNVANRHTQLERAAQKAATVVRPPVHSAGPESATVLTEPALFEKFDAMIVEHSWNGAATMAHEARLAKPSWLARRETDLFVRLMQIAHESGETGEMLGAAKQLAVRVETAGNAVDFGEVLQKRGAEADACAVLRIVERLQPAYVPAQRLAEHWKPKKRAGPPSR